MAGHMYVAMIPVKTEGRIKWKNWKWRQENIKGAEADSTDPCLAQDCL